jgi:hypothetical protein
LPILPFFLPGAMALMLTVRKIRDLSTPLARHADGLALKRYGNPAELLADIDSELAAPGQRVQFGERARSFQVSASLAAIHSSAEVFLTPSWLACFSGVNADHLTIFRIADIVSAHTTWVPVSSYLVAPFTGHTWVALTDRHGARLKLLLRNTEALRLLSEIFARVPRADANFARFVAAVDRRREELRITDRTPPTSPS